MSKSDYMRNNHDYIMKRTIYRCKIHKKTGVFESEKMVVGMDHEYLNRWYDIASGSYIDMTRVDNGILNAGFSDYYHMLMTKPSEAKMRKEAMRYLGDKITRLEKSIQDLTERLDVVTNPKIE